MGLFDFFTRRRDTRTASEAGNAGIPTVKGDPGFPKIYAQVYRAEIRNVEGIPERDTEDLLRLIEQAEGGPFNQSAYAREGYDRYFKGRRWVWREHEEWSAIFKEFGEYPAWWNHLEEPKELRPEDVLDGLRVAELKEFLTAQGIEFDPRMKKRDLVQLGAAADIKKTAIWREAVERRADAIPFSLFLLLMRTILARAKHQSDVARARAAGVKKHTLVIDDDQARFVELARKRRPREYPPFYPGDLSGVRSVLPGLGED